MSCAGPVAVLGATGFVGAAVVDALQYRGIPVKKVRSPRLTDDASVDAAVRSLEDQLADTCAVICCAGVAEATYGHASAFHGANVLLPGALAGAARAVGVRLVHISSAAVLGDTPMLDNRKATSPFSEYSKSKAAGEHAVLEIGGNVVVYRPPGVHGRDRSVTRAIARLARSPLSSVAAPGGRPSPNVLLQDVADAIAYLALCPERPPPIVHHPPSAITTDELLRYLGNRDPLRVPTVVARATVKLLGSAQRLIPSMGGHVRRLEVLWFGQAQAPSWLTENGWKPVTGPEDWARLGRHLRNGDDE